MTNLWATKQKSKDFRPILGRMQQNSGFFAKLPPALTPTNPNFLYSAYNKSGLQMLSI